MIKKKVSDFYSEHYGYVSDKWSSYLPVYDRWFAAYQDAPIHFLEVGVQNGGSLQIWAKYFVNAKKIIGCDINPKCNQLIYDDPRIALVIGDIKSQMVRKKISENGDFFDVIIDDGSHKNSDIIKTFEAFYPHLAPGGIYVVEDLHCSYWAKWHGGLWRADSAMEFFKNLTDVLNLESWGVKLLPKQLVSRLNSKSYARFKPTDYADIESVTFYNSMCLIVKGHGPNSIGGRVVVGKEALVNTSLPGSGSAMLVTFQKKNFRKLKLKK